MREGLGQYRTKLESVALLYTIGEAQSAPIAVSSPEPWETLQHESLDRFPARLPGSWQEEGARPSHATCVRKSRHWRTRKDPFEGNGATA